MDWLKWVLIQTYLEGQHKYSLDVAFDHIFECRTLSSIYLGSIEYEHIILLSTKSFGGQIELVFVLFRCIGVPSAQRFQLL